jgi:single-stranded DNA-binding protein
MLSVFVKELTEPNEDNPNAIELTGYLCKAPIYRTTPFNREIADLLIAVNRAPQTSDYIPCIAWGRNARMAKSMFIGDRIFIGGRIQSREYQKRFEDGSIETRVAFEVSINQLFREEENPESMEQALSLNSMSSY